MPELHRLMEGGRQEDDPTRIIVTLLDMLTSGTMLRDFVEFQEKRLTPDSEGLIGQFRMFMANLHDSGAWDECLSRTSCPSCNSVPIKSCFTTSCMHVYCEECFLAMRESAENSGLKSPHCSTCEVEIEQSARCNSVQDLLSDSSPSPPPQASSAKQKNKKQQPKQKQKKKGMFDDLTTLEDDDYGETADWIPIVGDLMPSAKLTAARNIIAGWLAEAPDTKVVILTQFRSIIQIFSYMCQNENWGYALLTGEMAFAARDVSIQEIRDKEELRVMIASLKAGGIGLDLTMANKCILVDPWWNEAVQQQVSPGAFLSEYVNCSFCLKTCRPSVVFSELAR